MVLKFMNHSYSRFKWRFELEIGIVKSQIALFECSQTKLTGSIGTPEAPDQHQMAKCLVLGLRCDTSEMRWSTPRTNEFVFSQS